MSQGTRFGINEEVVWVGMIQIARIAVCVLSVVMTSLIVQVVMAVAMYVVVSFACGGCGDVLGVMDIRDKVGGDIGNGVSNKCNDCSGSYGAVSGEGYRDHVAGEVRGCVADKGCREGNVGHGIMRGN